MTSFEHMSFCSKKTVTDEPQRTKLDWFTKRIRKLPRKVKMILLGYVLLFIFSITYSGIQNYRNHTFEYIAAFIEMEALYSLQFCKQT